MCFSTEASFTAAIVLGVAGSITIKNCASKSLIFLAALPLLFAIQQFTEGVLWLYHTQHLDSNIILTIAMRIFLIFAFLIWPIWIPLALWAAEKIKFRRILILLDLACGIILSGVNLSYALSQKISVEIANHSIQYMGNIPPQIILYPLIVLIPCFISSLKNMWMFGALVTIGYMAAQYFYATTFVSVWCFFAAIVSLIIYKIIKDNQERVRIKEPLK